MDAIIEKAFNSKDKNILTNALLDFGKNHNDQALLQEFSEIVTTAVIKNTVKPIQVVRQYYIHRDDVLTQFKNYVADEIVQHNQTSFIEQAILGDITNAESIFWQAMLQKNISILDFFVNHDSIEFQLKWIEELQLYSYETTNSKFINYADSLYGQMNQQIESAFLFEMLKRAFLIQSIDNIEHLEKRCHFDITQLDSNQIKSLISFSTNNDSLYENSIEHQKKFLNFIVEHQLQPRHYLSSLIKHGIQSKKNPLLIAQIAHFAVEQKIDNITMSEISSVFEFNDKEGEHKNIFNMLKEKHNFENTISVFNKSKREPYKKQHESLLSKKIKI